MVGVRPQANYIAFGGSIHLAVAVIKSDSLLLIFKACTFRFPGNAQLKLEHDERTEAQEGRPETQISQMPSQPAATTSILNFSEFQGLLNLKSRVVLWLRELEQLPVEASVLDGLGDVMLSDGVLRVVVGEGAGDAEDFVVGAGAGSINTIDPHNAGGVDEEC